MKLSDQDHDGLPAPVRARLRVVDERALTRAGNIMDALTSKKPDLLMRLQNIVRSTESDPAIRMRATYQLVDEVSEIAKDNIACRKGCGYCCHMAVGISRLEARMIGAAINRKPREVPMRSSYADFDFGYHNPCTFLVNNECSIYEHRPLACRVFYSVDDDALLCDYGMSTPPTGFVVPQFDMSYFRSAYTVISGTTATAEIRDYFPRT